MNSPERLTIRNRDRQKKSRSERQGRGNRKPKKSRITQKPRKRKRSGTIFSSLDPGPITRKGGRKRDTSRRPRRKEYGSMLEWAEALLRWKADSEKP